MSPSTIYLKINFQGRERNTAKSGLEIRGNQDRVERTEEGRKTTARFIETKTYSLHMRDSERSPRSTHCLSNVSHGLHLQQYAVSFADPRKKYPDEFPLTAVPRTLYLSPPLQIHLNPQGGFLNLARSLPVSLLLYLHDLLTLNPLLSSISKPGAVCPQLAPFTIATESPCAPPQRERHVRPRCIC